MMINKRMLQLIVFLELVFSLASCRAIRPYEKEFLLHPTMDDARVERLMGPYGKTVRPAERLGSLTGGASSSSCPTCGG